MRRLAPPDRALIPIVTTLWVVSFGLGVRAVIQDGADHPGLGLSIENAVSYPALTGALILSNHPSDPLAQAGLRAGDRLIRVGAAPRAAEWTSRRCPIPLGE